MSEELIKRLAQKHLGHLQYREGIYPSDVEINKSYLDSELLLPLDLSMNGFMNFIRGHQIQGSEAYHRRVRREAVLLAMGYESQGIIGKQVELRQIARFLAEKTAD